MSSDIPYRYDFAIPFIFVLWGMISQVILDRITDSFLEITVFGLTVTFAFLTWRWIMR